MMMKMMMMIVTWASITQSENDIDSNDDDHDEDIHHDDHDRYLGEHNTE